MRSPWLLMLPLMAQPVDIRDRPLHELVVEKRPVYAHHFGSILGDVYKGEI